jgi:hypothetical protein
MHFVMQEASNFQTPTKMAGKAVENKGLSKEGTITKLTPAEQHCYVRWKGSDQPSRKPMNIDNVHVVGTRREAQVQPSAQDRGKLVVVRSGARRTEVGVLELEGCFRNGDSKDWGVQLIGGDGQFTAASTAAGKQLVQIPASNLHVLSLGDIRVLPGVTEDQRDRLLLLLPVLSSAPASAALAPAPAPAPGPSSAAPPAPPVTMTWEVSEYKKQLMDFQVRYTHMHMPPWSCRACLWGLQVYKQAFEMGYAWLAV